MLLTIALLLIILILAVWLYLALAKNSDLEHYKINLEHLCDQHRRERELFDRILTQQARKIDRALWMLVSANTVEHQHPADIDPECSLSIKLTPRLLRAVSQGERQGHEELVQILAEHIVRRVAKKAPSSE